MKINKKVMKMKMGDKMKKTVMKKVMKMNENA